MPNSNRPSQPRQSSDTNKDDLNPLTFSPGQRKRNGQWAEDEPLAEEDLLASNPPRPPSSAIRLNNPTTGRRVTRDMNDMTPETTRQPVLVPPRRTAQAYNPLPDSTQARSGRNTTIQPVYQSPATVKRESKNIHWMVYVGVGMIAALALWVTGSSILAWGINKYNDLVYGYPRLYQTDAVVHHNGDSEAHPSHFMALNLHGQVIIIELPAGDPTKSIDYIGPDLIASGDDRVPITLSFGEVNNDKKIDMIIHIQDKEVDFCNNGTKFTACSP